MLGYAMLCHAMPCYAMLCYAMLYATISCAMQLGAFLGPKVDKVGGMMAMTDVYCLFNRARGTELVSPDDLLQACTCFPQAGVPLTIKQFSTGALVVQSRSHSTEQVCGSQCLGVGHLIAQGHGQFSMVCQLHYYVWPSSCRVARGQASWRVSFGGKNCRERVAQKVARTKCGSLVLSTGKTGT